MQSFLWQVSKELPKEIVNIFTPIMHRGLSLLWYAIHSDQDKQIYLGHHGHE